MKNFNPMLNRDYQDTLSFPETKHSDDGTDSEGNGFDWSKLLSSVVDTTGKVIMANNTPKPAVTVSGGQPAPISITVPSTPTSKKGMSTGAIIGIVFGGLVVIGGVVYFAVKK